MICTLIRRPGSLRITICTLNQGNLILLIEFVAIFVGAALKLSKVAILQKKRRSKKRKWLFAGPKGPLRDTSTKNSCELYTISNFGEKMPKNGHAQQQKGPGFARFDGQMGPAVARVGPSDGQQNGHLEAQNQAQFTTHAPHLSRFMAHFDAHRTHLETTKCKHPLQKWGFVSRMDFRLLCAFWM